MFHQSYIGVSLRFLYVYACASVCVCVCVCVCVAECVFVFSALRMIFLLELARKSFTSKGRGRSGVRIPTRIPDRSALPLTEPATIPPEGNVGKPSRGETRANARTFVAPRPVYKGLLTSTRDMPLNETGLKQDRDTGGGGRYHREPKSYVTLREAGGGAAGRGKLRRLSLRRSTPWDREICEWNSRNQIGPLSGPSQSVEPVSPAKGTSREPIARSLNPDLLGCRWYRGQEHNGRMRENAWVPGPGPGLEGTNVP